MIPQRGLNDSTASYWTWCCMLMFSLNHTKKHKTNKWQSWVCLSYLMLTILRCDYCAHCAVDAETIYCAGNPTRSQRWAGPNNPTWCESVHGALSAQSAADGLWKTDETEEILQISLNLVKVFPLNFCLPSHWTVLSSSCPLVVSLQTAVLYHYILFFSKVYLAMMPCKHTPSLTIFAHCSHVILDVDFLFFFLNNSFYWFYWKLFQCHTPIFTLLIISFHLLVDGCFLETGLRKKNLHPHERLSAAHNTQHNWKHTTQLKTHNSHVITSSTNCFCVFSIFVFRNTKLNNITSTPSTYSLDLYNIISSHLLRMLQILINMRAFASSF